MPEASHSHIPAELPALSTLADKWEALLVGRADGPGSPTTDLAKQKLDDLASQVLAKNRDNPDLFAGMMTSDGGSAIWLAMRELRVLAYAFRTEGSKYLACPRIFQLIRDSLTTVDKQVFTAGMDFSGNWWEWCVGIPQTLMDICLLVRNEVPLGELQRHFAAVDYVIADPSSNPWILPDQVSVMTSANLVDQSQSVLVASILRGDTRRVEEVARLLSTQFVFAEREGLAPDGSYVFHKTVPYNGTYGGVAFRVLSKFGFLFSETPYAFDESCMAYLDTFVERGLLPFMVTGGMSDVVRGRAVARPSTEGDNIEILADVVRYALISPSGLSSQWLQKCAYHLGFYSTEQLVGELSEAMTSKVPQSELISELLADENLPPSLQAAHHNFPRMVRAVHTSSHNWAASLAMVDRKISHYEHGLDENTRGFHQGSGMLLVHVPGDPFHYSNGFWDNVDPRNLPGTTVEEILPGDGAGGPWGAVLGVNSWAGGAVYRSRFASMGMHMHGFQSSLRARKSWFFLGDGVVCIGSGIRGGDSPVHTTVESRFMPFSQLEVTAAGSSVHLTDSMDGVFQEVESVHVEGLGSFVFLNPARILNVKISDQIFPNADVDNVRSDLRERRLVSIQIDHGEGPQDEAYAYAIFPNASPSSTQSSSDAVGIDLLSNGPVQQAIYVASLDAVFVNVFMEGVYSWVDFPTLELDAPCSLILVRDGDRILFSLADPTRERGSINVKVHTGRGATRLKHTEPGTEAGSDGSGSVEFTVDVSHGFSAEGVLPGWSA